MHTDSALWFGIPSSWWIFSFYLQPFLQHKTPESIEATQAVVQSMFPVQHTFWGGMWETIVKPADVITGNRNGIARFCPSSQPRADTAFTTMRLEGHMDCTYLRDGPGIQVHRDQFWTCERISAKLMQVFHCLQAAHRGGETMLVDGFNAAKLLKARSPQNYEFLSKHRVPFRYLDPGVRDLRTRQLVLEHENPFDHLSGKISACYLLDCSGDSERLVRFRYNNYDRDVLDFSPDDTLRLRPYYRHACIGKQHSPVRFYDAWLMLTEILRSPASELRVLLQPGSTIFINNERFAIRVTDLLTSHARTHFIWSCR